MRNKKHKSWAIAGWGSSGQAVARYLNYRGISFTVHDEQISGDHQQCVLPLDMASLHDAATIVLSPGVSPQHPTICAAQQHGIPLTNELELFLDALRRRKDASQTHSYLPLAVITGTNGKSTVTTMLAQMLADCGWQVNAGGNLGPPMLDLLNLSAHFYVLELSSFQLEGLHASTTLDARVACVLNLSADHLDRHRNLVHYAAIKRRIYRGCGHAIVNQDQPLTYPHSKVKQRFFGQTSHDPAVFTLRNDRLYYGGKHLLSLDDLPSRGEHNALNTLAALAMGYELGVDLASLIASARCYRGLAHRGECIEQINGVIYLDDSKATNVDAARAAILCAAMQISGKIFLLAGGQDKHGDFAPLCPVLRKHVHCALLIGAAAGNMAAVWGKVVPVETCVTLDRAFAVAVERARPGDAVLLAPACASFDQFVDYRARGDAFQSLVRGCKKDILPEFI